MMQAARPPMRVQEHDDGVEPDRTGNRPRSASHHAAAARRRRAFLGPMASRASPYSSLERDFTSTTTTSERVRQMRSSSPSGVRWFCASTRYPRSDRKNAANCSPARPLAVRSTLVRASVSRVPSFGAAIVSLTLKTLLTPPR